MKRTQLESIGLIWHLLQMVIVTYLLAAPKRSVIDPAPFVWALVVIPFALGCWIGGLLQRPTAVTLLLAAVYWTAVALHLEGPFTFSFSMGITVDLKFMDNPKISIDLLAVCAAGIFFVACHRRRLTSGWFDRAVTASGSQSGNQ
jgi:hypothetical protein